MEASVAPHMQTMYDSYALVRALCERGAGCMLSGYAQDQCYFPPHCAPQIPTRVLESRAQVRLEVRHRGPLNLAVCLEAHPLNETAHAQIATWAPDPDKAAIEVEGARIARQLQVRRCAHSATDWVASDVRRSSTDASAKVCVNERPRARTEHQASVSEPGACRRPRFSARAWAAWGSRTAAATSRSRCTWRTSSSPSSSGPSPAACPSAGWCSPAASRRAQPLTASPCLLARLETPKKLCGKHGNNYLRAPSACEGARSFERDFKRDSGERKAWQLLSCGTHS